MEKIIVDRQILRDLVDKVYQEALEDLSVPSTKWADEIIDSVIPLHKSRIQKAIDAARGKEREGPSMFFA